MCTVLGQAPATVGHEVPSVTDEEAEMQRRGMTCPRQAPRGRSWDLSPDLFGSISASFCLLFPGSRCIPWTPTVGLWGPAEWVLSWCRQDGEVEEVGGKACLYSGIEMMKETLNPAPAVRGSLIPSLPSSRLWLPGHRAGGLWEQAGGTGDTRTMATCLLSGARKGRREDWREHTNF